MKLLPRRLKPHLFAVAYVRRVCEYRVKRMVGPSLRFVPVLMNKRQGPQRKAFDGLRPSFSAHVSRISCRSCWRCAPSHAWSSLVLRSRKSGQRWCERRAPVSICLPATDLRERPAVSHICQNQADMGHPAFAAGIEPKCVSQCRGTRAHGQRETADLSTALRFGRDDKG